jgi:phosphoglycerol transferase
VTDIFAKPYVEIKLQSTRPVLKWGVPIALVVVVMATVWLLTGGTAFNLDVPLIYGGDGLLILVMIKRVMEGSWLFHSTMMGAPFGSYLYDYPIPDSGSLFVLKWLGRASGSPEIALNLYYLIGFPVNALSAFFVLRKLRLSTALSFAGGFIFTILPFHFERISHLFYTWYFVAPIFILYAFKIYSGNYVEKPKGAWTSHVKNATVLLVLSCFGVYYSFFGVLTFITAGVMRYLRTRSIKSIRGAVLSVAIVTFGIVANVTPNLIDRYQNGLNREAAERSPISAEIYGLKTVQLLLPREGHRFAPFAKFTAKYSSSFPLVNENSTASLGLIGSIGFLALLLSFLAPRARQDERFFVLASITLGLLLFCSVGGFSSLFAMGISPLIRAWNRVSVFIAFTSITASLLMIEHVFVRRSARPHLIRWTIPTVVALCAFAFWDQTHPPCPPCQRTTADAVNGDAQFVAAIEKEVPEHSAIYQLPYVAFPEVPPVNQLGAYDQALGYLDSKTLRWSWGTMKGRPADLFYRSLATEPMDRQVEIARQLCFSGIYIDRRGYADNGAAMEVQLRQILGKPAALTSASKQQIFFGLNDDKHPACTLPNGISQEQIMQRAGLIVDESGVRYRATLSEGMNFSHDGTPSFLTSMDGLSVVESWGRWTDASVNPVLTMRFAQTLPPRFTLHLRAQGFGPNAGRPAQVVVGDEVQTFTPTAEPGDYSLSFDNPKGADLITIKPADPVSPSDLGVSADGRKLGLGMERLSIETLK